MEHFYQSERIAMPKNNFPLPKFLNITGSSAFGPNSSVQIALWFISPCDNEANLPTLVQ